MIHKPNRDKADSLVTQMRWAYSVAAAYLDTLDDPSRIERYCKRSEMERYREHSWMLGDIALVVKRYARKPETTTLEAVEAMDKRVKKLNHAVNLRRKVRKQNDSGHPPR